MATGDSLQRPTARPAAGVAVVEGGRVLLLRHVHDRRWGTPGGGVEVGESPIEAARRELMEETGLSAGRLSLVGAYGGQDFEVTYPDGSRTAYVVVLFATTSRSGQLRLQASEVTEAGRFTWDELASLDLQPDMRTMLPDVFEWHARQSSG